MKRLIFVADDAERPVEADDALSVMEVAKLHQVEGIDADCGGSMVCGTCHVYVRNGGKAALPPPSDIEAEMLDYVPQPDPDARLSCQIRVADCTDGMVFAVPPAQR